MDAVLFARCCLEAPLVEILGMRKELAAETELPKFDCSVMIHNTQVLQPLTKQRRNLLCSFPVHEIDSLCEVTFAIGLCKSRLLTRMFT